MNWPARLEAVLPLPTASAALATVLLARGQGASIFGWDTNAEWSSSPLGGVGQSKCTGREAGADRGMGWPLPQAR